MVKPAGQEHHGPGSRRSWEVAMGVLLVILAVVVVIGLAVGLRQAERRTFTFTEPVRRVEVDLRAGAVSFAAGDGPVRVHRTIRWALNRPTTSERVEEGVLRVEADWQGLRLPGGEVSYRVEVPAGVDVRAWTGAGAVAAAGLRGDVDIRTQAGRIDLVDLGGHVRAATQAGQVQGTGLAARQVEAQSNAGAVSLAFEAPPDRVEARTNAGSVDLVVPDQRYAVEAGSAAGRTVVELVGDPTAPRRLVARSNAGRVRVRRR
jgi:hypothetical protein